MNMDFQDTLVSKNLLEQDTIDLFNFPIFIKDAELRYVICNQAFYKFLKATPNQIIGRTTFDVAPGEQAEVFHKADLELLNKQGAQTYRTQVKDFDGVQHFVEFRKATFTSQDDQMFMLGSLVDLSDLEESFERCHLLADLASEGILMHSEGIIRECNASSKDIFHLSPEEFVDRPLVDFVDLRWKNYVTYLIKNNIEEQCEFEMIRGNGEHFPVLATFRNAYFKSSKIGAVSIRDRSGDLYQNHLVRKLWTAIEQSHNSVVMTDDKGNIEYVNPHFSKITGYSREEVLGRNPRILKSGRTPPSVYKDMWQSLLQHKTWFGELTNKRKDGKIYWERASIAPVVDRYNQTTGYIAVKDDVSLIKKQEEQLLHQAYYDGLTDLPNRILAYDRLEQALINAKRNDLLVGVMFVDLDDFKKVNDTLGHHVGDAILIESAKRLKSVTRTTDTVARQGGDEFLIIVQEAENTDVLARIARNVIQAFKEPFVHDGMDIMLSTSIGIALAPNDAMDSSNLMRNADLAMYRSKENGKNTFSYYARTLSENALRKNQIESEIRKYRSNCELDLAFQPVVDSVKDRTVGAEALLRWHSNVLGEVSPAEFIPVIEQSGLICEIGPWVMREACKSLANWEDRGLLNDEFYISVNISPRQFRDLTLPERVADLLTEYNLAPHRLKLEVTETLLLKDTEEVKNQLVRLCEMGVGLCMDDFGTGYSSLVALKRFPFTTVKIDRTFVDDIDDDEEERLLCSAAIAMGNSLKLTTVVEGVETQAQLDFVTSHGCHYIQGYFTGKPMAKAEFEALLQNKMYQY